MKYRNMLKNDNNTYNLVWFGSVGQIRPKSIIFNYTYRYNTTFTDISNTISNIPEKDDYNISFTNVVYTSPTFRLRFSIHITTGQSGINILSMNAGEAFGSPSQDYTGISSISFIISDGTKNITIDLTDKLITTTSKLSMHGIIQYFNTYDIDCCLPCFANKQENYVDKQEGVAKSLTQRLAVIKNELWYDINYGLPLIDKIKNKAVFDAYIIKTINAHQEVKKIKEYISSVDHGVYTYKCTAISIFDEEFDIGSEINI